MSPGGGDNRNPFGTILPSPLYYFSLSDKPIISRKDENTDIDLDLNFQARILPCMITLGLSSCANLIRMVTVLPMDKSWVRNGIIGLRLFGIFPRLVEDSQLCP
jgi:hypothetical protein